MKLASHPNNPVPQSSIHFQIIKKIYIDDSLNTTQQQKSPSISSATTKLPFQAFKIHCCALRIQTPHIVGKFQIIKSIPIRLRTLKTNFYNRLTLLKLSNTPTSSIQPFDAISHTQPQNLQNTDPKLESKYRFNVDSF